MHQSGGLIRKVWAVFTKKSIELTVLSKECSSQTLPDWRIGPRELSLNMGDRLAAR
jgi:hypothetical protein